MISVEEARAKLLAQISPVGAEQIALADGLGRVLAEDVKARLTHPPLAVSAMDGYALKAADAAQTPARLNVIGEAAAGHAFAGIIGSGQAVRIFTGAPVPQGADSVVMQEDAEALPGAVIIKEPAVLGRHVRPAGLDFAAGQILLPAGKRLSARDIALAAAMNVPWLKVRRRPRVAILSTGDEVVMPGDPLGESQIISSNGLGVAAIVRAAGADPIDLGIAQDDKNSLFALAEGARGADLLVTSGGVSVGDRDLVAQTLGETGLEIGFHKVAMRPGKPVMFGRFKDIPMLGLPGNPVSALVCALLYLVPALEKMQGLPDGANAPLPKLRLGADLPANDFRQDYLRARLVREADGEMTAHPFTKQDSAMMSALAGADCLIVRPPNAAASKAGEKVPVLILSAGGAFSF